MAKWYNKFIIGDPNKADFTAKDLPKNRVDQFFDVLKLRFSGMAIGNLLYTLFALPLLVWSTWYWVAFTQIKATEGSETFSSTIIGFLLVCIPLYTIMGPAKAGLHYCLRNWCWNERATIREHFWKEFKRSFGKALLLNFLNAGILFAGVWWITTLLMNNDRYPWMRFAALAIGIILVAYFMSSIYQFPQLVTYDLKIPQIIKNSFIYLVAQFPRTLLAVVCYALIAVLCYFLLQVLAVVMLTVGMSVVFLAQTVFSQFLFDKYVNAPEARRRGMAPLE